MPAILSTECSLNGDWNATEIHFSRHHSVAIQPPFNHHSIDWKVTFHPVFMLAWDLLEMSQNWVKNFQVWGKTPNKQKNLGTGM